MRPMRTERAIDLIARLALSWRDTEHHTEHHTRVILHPIGPANIDRVLERMTEIRQDMRPDARLKDQAWNLLLEQGESQ